MVLLYWRESERIGRFSDPCANDLMGGLGVGISPKWEKLLARPAFSEQSSTPFSRRGFQGVILQMVEASIIFWICFGTCAIL
jgi:hypothetical protein